MTALIKNDQRNLGKMQGRYSARCRGIFETKTFPKAYNIYNLSEITDHYALINPNLYHNVNYGSSSIVKTSSNLIDIMAYRKRNRLTMSHVIEKIGTKWAEVRFDEIIKRIEKAKTAANLIDQVRMLDMLD
jgi:hypothetical protein